jgi:hypothetical protein
MLVPARYALTVIAAGIIAGTWVRPSITGA